MRILIFNWRDIKHSWAGGGEIYIFEQAKRWVKLGHTVSLFCAQGYEKELPDTEVIDGIHIYRRGNRFTVYVWAFWYYLTLFRGKFDVLIDIVNGIPFFTPIYCTLPKLSLVYHVHENQFFYELPFPLNYVGYITEKYIFPFVYQRIPVVAISQTTKKQLVRYGFRPNNISIVYSGIGDTFRNNKKRKKFSHPTILYLGRIKKYKRVELLVKIFPKIVKQVPSARLIIAGWGTEGLKVTDLVMKNPLRRKIDLMGPVSNKEKIKLLSKSWLFVNPSIGEGWSIAVIEANFYHTPAISFRVPGLSESIKHNVTGLLVNGEDELVQKISEILKNKRYCLALGNNAQKWALTFSWNKTAKRSLRLIDKIRLT